MMELEKLETLQFTNNEHIESFNQYVKYIRLITQNFESEQQYSFSNSFNNSQIECGKGFNFVYLNTLYNYMIYKINMCSEISAPKLRIKSL